MKTDLEQVKAKARMLLYTDVHLTEFSPLVVQHPFTKSGYVGIRQDHKVQILNIAVNEDDLRIWRMYVYDLIDRCESAHDVYMLFTEPYALTFLYHARIHLSKHDLSEILASAWTASENPNQDPNVSKRALLSMFRSADPGVLMTANDMEIWKALPADVTVYRGVTSDHAGNIRALSWTLQQSTAEWFAHRFGENGTVYEAHISKEHTYAYFNNRDEAEIIVDPKHLTGITKYGKLS